MGAARGDVSCSTRGRLLLDEETSPARRGDVSSSPATRETPRLFPRELFRDAGRRGISPPMNRAEVGAQRMRTNATGLRGAHGRAPRARHLLGCLAALTLGACHPPGGTEAPQTSPSATTPVELKTITAKALSTVANPAAAVVLSIRDREVLPLAEVNGGDATNTALRPGSTTKPLLAYAAIERGVLPGKFTCERTYHDLTCIARHGEIDLETAIAVSCNTYFYDIAHTLGPEQSMAALRSFGFGAPTRLVPHEAAGYVPTFTAEDLEARYMATATGHGQLRVTLLQLAAAYATLATKLTEASAKTDSGSQALSSITSGMRASVEKQDGKGHRAAVERLAVAGKTGSGEPGTEIGPPTPGVPENGWFVAYAPIAAPEIVVAVQVVGVEGSGASGPGAEHAAPIAGEILRNWFATRLSRPTN